MRAAGYGGTQQVRNDRCGPLFTPSRVLGEQRRSTEVRVCLD
jgi:hypothetical protein